MIVTRLMGGLGNQMFQYAAGRRLAQHHGTELKLDLTWFDNVEVDTRREYELGCFELKAAPAEPKEIEGLTMATPYLMGFFGKRKKLTMLGEKHYQFDPAVLKAPDNVLLQGFWQSEKYFKDAQKLIRKDFIVKNPPTGNNKAVLLYIEEVNAVSLHVRRGDYVTSKATNEFHGTATLDYYRKAMAYMAKKIEHPHFFVFSDDTAWCKKNLKIDFPATYVDHNPANKGFEDMRLMIACDHHIIANSSFSWWGAWLNPSKDKIVAAPKQWFRDKSIDTSDLIPKDWVRL